MQKWFAILKFYSTFSTLPPVETRTVCRLSLKFIATANQIVAKLSRMHRHKHRMLCSGLKRLLFKLKSSINNKKNQTKSAKHFGISSFNCRISLLPFFFSFIKWPNKFMTLRWKARDIHYCFFLLFSRVKKKNEQIVRHQMNIYCIWLSSYSRECSAANITSARDSAARLRGFLLHNLCFFFFGKMLFLESLKCSHQRCLKSILTYNAHISYRKQ